MTTQLFPQASQFADLILDVGLNLQPGQRLLVTQSLVGGVDIQLAPLVRTIADKAYRRGASYVDVIWEDPDFTVMWLKHSRIGSIAPFPRWFGRALLEHAEAGDAFLALRAPQPDLLADFDSQLKAALFASVLETVKDARQYLRRDAVNWCVACVPSPLWSAKVFPDMPEADRESALWTLIAQACRLGGSDPLAAWHAHLDSLAARAKHLTDRKYSSLVYSAPGTQLSVGLPSGHIWQGGRAIAGNGVPFVANLPTEEIFTLPHRDQVEGTVTTTRPFSYLGSTIDGMTLVFSHGKVVSSSAKVGEEMLHALLQTDEGAVRLGEAAFVPHSSPISQMGITFHNDLFDENASTHLALGDAYKVCLQEGDSLTDEEFVQRGGNQSDVHCDFMVGSAALDLDGIRTDGEAEPILRGGDWAFDV
jgi:aminopeptidase